MLWAKGVLPPRERRKWEGEEGEVQREKQETAEMEEAVKRESRRARATEAEALFVEN